MARFDLTDYEWSVIQPLLPTKVRGVKRRDDRQVLNGIFWRLRTGRALGGHSGPLWPLYNLREPLQPMAEGGRLGTHSCGHIRGLRRRHPDDRQLVDPGSPARGERPEKGGRSRCPLGDASIACRVIHVSLAGRVDNQDTRRGRYSEPPDPDDADRGSGL